MMSKNPQFPAANAILKRSAVYADAMVCVTLGLATVFMRPAAAAEPQVTEGFVNAGNRETLDHIARRYWPKCAKCVADEAKAANP